MCPDVIRGPYSRPGIFFPQETFQKCDSQQGFFNAAFDSLFELHDDRRSALLLSCERAQQQIHDPGNYANYQPMHCDSPPLTEIDTGWMSDVFEGLPVISQEMTHVPVAEISAPFSNYSPFNSPLPVSLDLLSSEAEEGQSNQQSSPTCAGAVPLPLDIDQTGPICPDSNHSVLEAAAFSPPCPQSLGATSPPAAAVVPKPLKARGSKRCDRGQQKPKRMPKWAREVTLAPSEQVEHVLRERQRRDDMSCKIAILEGLLPPCPKRDRASIVHDSVQYVKSLQQGVEELQKKLVALKRSNGSPATTITTTITTTQISSLPQLAKATSPSSSPARDSTSPAIDAGVEDTETVPPKLFHLVEFHVQLEGCSEAAKLTRCKCRSDYLSSTMRVLEQLNVEVSRCSVTKMFDHFMCVIVAKMSVGKVPAIEGHACQQFQLPHQRRLRPVSRKLLNSDGEVFLMAMDAHG
ncbi:hypothetical protein AXG93_773s1830 [Marchantia polymorpha subsp. ruderalis]|uniref:BHLH domain-containing protein n=1 Tax=Marchantia polymorpha subsp. ruderalis TaxID=1480154 RepID=A0A176WC28_MARPO|nr:hypothetical protein AXG93_773s1830 [Marchantia polymorpha subsp. ruderalis]